MDVAAVNTPQWSVSARSRGEVLAVGAAAGGLELLVLSDGGLFSRAEFEGWLRDVLGVACETAAGDTGARPIPALLHHALTGLLFSHSELWERTESRPPCSLAFAVSGHSVAFGWVGDARVGVWVNEMPVEHGWVKVRDDAGREAFAIALEAGSTVRVRLVWAPGDIGDEGPGAIVDAEWPGSDTLALAAALAAAEAAAIGGVSADPVAAVADETFVAAESGDSVVVAEATDEREDAGFETPEARHADALSDETIEEEIGVRKRPGRLSRFMSRMAGLLGGRRRSRDADGETPDWNARETENAAAALERERGASVGADGAAADGFAVEASPNTHDAAAELAGGEMHATPDEPANGPAAATPRVVPLHRPLPELIPPPSPRESLRRARTEELDTVRDTSRPTPLEPGQEREASSEEPRTRRREVLPGLTGVAPPVLRVAPRTPPVSAVPPPESITIPRVIPSRSGERDDGVEDQTSPPRPSLSGPAFLGDDDDPGVRARRPRVAREAEGSTPRAASAARPPLRPNWPTASELRRPTPAWRKPWAWVAVTVVLFLAGWWVGNLQPDANGQGVGPRIRSMLRTVGLGGARFDVTVTSNPTGAWIAVDGKDLARRTPATVDLAPGSHQMTLSLAELGSAAFTVRGQRGDRVALDAPLLGALSVEQSDAGIPVTVALDGRELGFAPVKVDSVSPGAHELRFSGPAMEPWAQTVEVRVQQTAQVLARPMTSPATGVIVVQGQFVDENGSSPLSGADVYVDGELRGRTPLTLELPRGPHSVRVNKAGENSPVQVIDLPGGNQRFANFELGLGIDAPQLSSIGVSDRVPPDRPSIAAASLDGVGVGEVREMWLHVRGADGPWRRYPMEMLKSSTGIVGVSVFPIGVFDSAGKTRYYMSALTGTGDEYFTEIEVAQLIAAPHPAANPR
jgi:PEGA domain